MRRPTHDARNARNRISPVRICQPSGLWGWLGLGLIIGCFGATDTALAQESRAATSRTNVLWIVADDLAARVWGAYSGKHALTPHIDQLAARGTRFDRAFCNSPVCTASRQSFLTGRYPRTLGVTQLATALADDQVTLAERLAAAGYATAAIGKMHFNSDSQHGFELRVDAADHRAWLEAQPPAELPPGLETLGRWRPFADPARVWLNADALPYPLPAARMQASYFVDRAAQFLTETRKQPFFLVVSFYEPHSPFHFPVELAGRHRASEFAAPGVDARDRAQIPAVFADLEESDKQGIAAAAATSVEFLDAQVGRILTALDHSGHADDTVVMFFSDHGYLLGEHGRFEKHTMYEEAVRVPLVIWDGRIRSEVDQRSAADNAASALPDEGVQALVELVDLVPTVLDLCGLPADDILPGKSLLALIDGRASSLRERVFAEYAENAEAMLRDERWKFVYSSGRRQRRDGYAPVEAGPQPDVRLFDTQNDPRELENLASHADQADRVAVFRQELLRRLLATSHRPPRLDESAAIDDRLAELLEPTEIASGRP